MEERNAENVIKRYAVSTVLMYVLTIVLIVIAMLVNFIILIPIFFMPAITTWISSKYAKQNTQIKTEDKIMSKIMIVNLLTHGLLAFATVMISIAREELGMALFMLFILAVIPIFISFRMFRDEKNIETAVDSGAIQVNPKASIDRDDLYNLDESITLQQLTSSASIGGIYVAVMFTVIGIILLLARIEVFFEDLQILFFFMRMISPTIAVVISCLIIKYFKLQIRKGDKLLRHIMGSNFGIYFIVVLITNITIILVWIVYALAFIPVFIISFFSFKKIEDNATEMKDINGRVINFKPTKFAGGVTDDRFREFLIGLGIGSINYFYAESFRGKFGSQRIKQDDKSWHYMIAFDNEQVYMFEASLTKIYHLHIVPCKAIYLSRWLEMENKTRLELVLFKGVNLILLEVRFNVSGMHHQEEMLKCFLALFK